VVVRVTVADSDSAGGLIRELIREVDAEYVSFEAATQQVCVEFEKNPDQTLVLILNAVEGWLGAGDRQPTRVEIDDHSYVLGAAHVAGGVL
jgi:hypothetical protein